MTYDKNKLNYNDENNNSWTKKIYRQDLICIPLCTEDDQWMISPLRQLVCIWWRCLSKSLFFGKYFCESVMLININVWSLASTCNYLL